MSDAIDWPGIRANAVTLGIRGSARAAAHDLPADEQDRFVERVMKRASREGWETQRLSVMSATMSAGRNLSANHAKPLSASVRNGAEAMQSVLDEHREAGTLSLAKAARRNADRAAEADLLIETPGDLLSLAKAHAVIHRIDQQQSQAPVQVLNVAFLLDCQRVSGANAEPISVEQRLITSDNEGHDKSPPE